MLFFARIMLSVLKPLVLFLVWLHTLFEKPETRLLYREAGSSLYFLPSCLCVLSMPMMNMYFFSLLRNVQVFAQKFAELGLAIALAPFLPKKREPYELMTRGFVKKALAFMTIFGWTVLGNYAVAVDTCCTSTISNCKADFVHYSPVQNVVLTGGGVEPESLARERSIGTS